MNAYSDLDPIARWFALTFPIGCLDTGGRDGLPLTSWWARAHPAYADRLLREGIWARVRIPRRRP